MGPVPQLEELFRASAGVLGTDLDGYRNHTQRVFHFAQELGAEGPEAERKLAIACYFHDLGIWTDQTFDYLEPSVVRATAYLEEQGLSEWGEEIASMIREHHKITRAGSADSLVEIFRRADWIDVSLGILRFGIPGPFLREVQQAFPDCGFHRRLVVLTLDRLRTHPFSPLPMFHW
ncbi:MAG: HD domain-containing protein [Deltaproteobacteria bacterium]|nr:HD domain-containing protein [Deltaproteobacteria bacterium]MBW2396767.1 HD domain-containing protein [Deltaproteobacteria bacterium]